MAGIFISYRREDTGGYARGILQSLKEALHRPIFMDIDTIDPGSDFVETIENAVGSCDVLIALIGIRWIGATDENGQKRLNNPMDLIRLEIATALERNIKVIPVLISGATMPRASDLPEPLKGMIRRQALKVSDERWEYDIGRLIQAVNQNIAKSPHKTSKKQTKMKPFYRVLGFIVVISMVAAVGAYLFWYQRDTREVKFMKFIDIPVGEFYMGFINGESDEKPVRKVRISEPFQLGKYEVTQAQWKAEMGDNPSFFEGEIRPVEMVSWYDVQEFIQKKNQRSDGYVYRLPTEAEWEYAARAGTTGNEAVELDEVCWHKDNSGDETHPVGEKEPNGWGIHDMNGNVWEWVQDWYGEDYYVTRPDSDSDPPGPPSGLVRVVRGGSWNNKAWFCRAASRGWSGPDGSSNFLGFRLLRKAR